MTRISQCAVALVLLALFLPAQGPPGFPGFNDYTVGGLGSNMPSCTTLFLTPGVNVFATSTAPGASVFLYATLLPCTPSSIFGCQGSQLVLPFPPLPVEIVCGVADAAGDFSFPIPLPPGLSFSTQTLILDASCLPFPLFSQGHNCQT